MSGLSDQQLRQLRVKLKELRETLKAQYELGQAGAGTVTLDQSRVGRLSRMDALQQQKMAESSQHNTKNRLRRVDIALAKIDSGDYAYCEACGEDIAYPRLEVQPEAALCLRCQSRRESGS